MKSLSEIRSILRANAAELRARYAITNIAVFGSVVRGETTERSDVDIIADIPDDTSLLGVIAIENHLSDLLGLKVDFVPRSDIRRELRGLILAEAVAV